MARSFRLRLALSIALLAGLALTGFGAIAWWQVRQASLEDLDRELRDQIERELPRQWPMDHWPQHARNIVKALGAHDIRQTLLLFVDDGNTIYRSPHWSMNLLAEALPWPSASGDLTASNNPRAPDEARDRQQPQPPHPERLPPPARDAPPNSERPLIKTMTMEADGSDWRLGLALSGRQRLAIGVDLSVINEGMTDLRNAFLLAAPFALGFIGIGAWLFSGRALSPIQRLTLTMEKVTAKGLDQRIPDNAEDREFERLIRVFNEMLERLKRSFLQASRFSADAAHELKTPLAILQGQIECALTQCEDGSNVQQILSSLLDEVQRLAAISRKLLLLCLADAGRLRLNMTSINLTQLLEELLEDAQMLAPKLRISGSITAGLEVNADSDLLRQVLNNLISNAIKYNVPQGWIHVTAKFADGCIAIAIENSSVGIPSVDRERIFERFYRVDRARTRTVEGAGLGLSLSREIVRAHGGELRLVVTEPGVTGFALSLQAKMTIL